MHDPLAARIHTGLAGALRQHGRGEEALTHYHRAAELAPDDAVAQGNLGQMLLSLGRYEAAIPPCREAVRLRPDMPLLHLILGDALRCAEQFAEAQAAYREAVRLQPKLAQAHANLGLLLRTWRKHREALAPLRRALELAPQNASFWKYLAEVHADGEDFAAAVPCWERALALQSGDVTLHLGLGAALREAGRFAEAEEHLQTALRLRPDLPEVHLERGQWHEQTGDAAQAEASYREALHLQPTLTAAWVALLRLLRGRLPDADCQAVEARLADPQVPDSERAKLLFALAAVLDERGEYGRAADAARQANTVALGSSRRRGGYEPEQHQRFIEGLIQVFDSAFFQRTAGAGLLTRRPVFIVGLPRSGTTLLEQILASHARVHGAGELHLARDTFRAVPAAVGRDGDDPLACVAALDAAAVRRLAEQHLARLDALDGGRAERIIDKLPSNYQYLGLLAAMFPQAVFLHCRRDLRDVAVSCWLTDFRWLEWTHDPGHIAARFAAYRRLMEHWRRVLPVPLHEIAYEDVVADLEASARRLVAACGLDWEPACLEFHRTRRPVRTASAGQVRTPLYAQSVGRWRHYERELADLFARLPPG